jgi:hypothetical protein
LLAIYPALPGDKLAFAGTKEGKQLGEVVCPGLEGDSKRAGF